MHGLLPLTLSGIIAPYVLREVSPRPTPEYRDNRLFISLLDTQRIDLSEGAVMSNTIMLKGRVRMGSWSFPASAEATNAPCLHPLFILARASVQFYAPMSVDSCAPVSAFASLQDR